VQAKAASAPRTPAVPPPCGGNVGAVQPKVVSAPRVPALPPPCGGRVAPSRTVQPKVAPWTPPSATLQAKSNGRPVAVVQRSVAAADPYAGKWWPLNAADRPYDGLDEAKYPGTASRFKEFSADQRAFILAANRTRNGGTLKSDDAKGDPHQDLVEQTGHANSAEIDHIIPKSRGGSNHFKNARVISWELNNTIARVKDTTGLTAT
jgi:hypothetical protein